MLALIEPSQVPARAPLIPLAGTVIFPAGMLPVALRTPQTIAAAEAALGGTGLVIVVTRTSDPEPFERALLTIGTLAQVLQPRRTDQGLFCQLKGLARVRAASFTHRSPYLAAELEQVPEATGEAPAGLAAFRARALDLLLQDAHAVPFSWLPLVAGIADPSQLIDMVATNASVALQLKQRVLETPSLEDRLIAAEALLSAMEAALPARRPWLATAHLALRRLRWRLSSASRNHLMIRAASPMVGSAPRA